jgi:hypothetical protein
MMTEEAAFRMADEHDCPTEDFATLFARHEKARALQVGQVVKGRIIHIASESSVFGD